jgi:hypothetical protein
LVAGHWALKAISSSAGIWLNTFGSVLDWSTPATTEDQSWQLGDIGLDFE